MTKSLQNTKTRENLMKAFAGESMAMMRYTYYAKEAKKEGYVQIANIFLETAENEKAHAKRFFRFLGEKEDTVLITEAAYPIGLSTKTVENLMTAADGEKEENSVLYPHFQKTALEEGFDEVAKAFEEIIEVEHIHEERYRKLRKNILDKKVFKRDKEVVWKCLNCGYHYLGKEAPEICPSCLHKQEYFEIFCKNY